MMETKLIEVMAVAIATQSANERGYRQAHEAEIIGSRSYARAALSAAEEAGYAIVPREPTKAMVIAGSDAIEEKREYTQDSYEEYEITNALDLPGPCYRAMLAAAE